MRAIEMGNSGKFTLADVSDSALSGAGFLVGVRSVSINRGEVSRARAAGPGFRPGWDFAGVILDKSGTAGPPVGAAVAGYVSAGAWAEKARHSLRAECGLMWLLFML